MHRKIEAHVEFHRFYARDLALTFFSDDGHRLAVGQPVVMEDVDRNIACATGPGPTVSLTREAAQKLADDLWRLGIRPTEAAGSAGSYSAQGAHLSDMRKIAFCKLGIEDD